MNTVPVLYYLKRDHPDVSEDRSYLCNKYIAHYGSPTSNIDLPSLQWGPKEEATKYTERTADFLITFAWKLLSVFIRMVVNTKELEKMLLEITFG